MPMRYEIDPQLRLVRSTAWGVFTGDDVRRHQASLASDPAFDDTYRQIADCRGVTDARIDAESIREAARARLFDPGARRALVASDDLRYGLGRMFQQVGEFDEEHGQVFRTLAEALAFLGLTAAEARLPPDATPNA